MSLSAREKVLLMILAVIVILLGGYMVLIKPAVTGLYSAKATLQSMNIQKEAAQMNIQTARTLESSISEAQQAAVKASSVFFPSLQDNMLHVWANGILSSSGVTVYNINISRPIAKSIQPAGGAQNSPLSYPLGDIAQRLNGSSSSQNTGTKAQNSQALEQVESATVTLSFTSDYNTLKKFLDNIKNSGRTAKVVSVGTTVVNNTLSVNISVECYGIAKLDKSDPLSVSSSAGPSNKTNPFQ